MRNPRTTTTLAINTFAIIFIINVNWTVKSRLKSGFVGTGGNGILVQVGMGNTNEDWNNTSLGNYFLGARLTLNSLMLLSILPGA